MISEEGIEYYNKIKSKENVNLKEELISNIISIYVLMDSFEDYLCTVMQERVAQVKDYIEQLETREQKLIDKLEEIVKSKYIAVFEGETEFEDDAIEMKTVKYIKLNDLEEILSIVKGEKNIEDKRN